MAQDYGSGLAADRSSIRGPRAIQPSEQVFCATHGTALVCPSCTGAKRGKPRGDAKPIALRRERSAAAVIASPRR